MTQAYTDPSKAIDEARAQEEGIMREAIEKDALLFMELVKTPGFKRLEEIINAQISGLLTEVIMTENDNQAIKNRYLVRGKKNILDLVYGTIDSLKIFKEEEAKNEKK